MLHISFFQVTGKAVERSLKDPGIRAAMRTVFWMATEDIPMSKYPSLVHFLKCQGCDNLTRIDVGKNACYNSRTAGEDFQECVGEVIENYVVAAIKKAPFFSVLTDESTDISISKQMVTYVRIVTENFEPRTFLYPRTKVILGLFGDIFTLNADYIAWKLLKMALEVEYMMDFYHPGLLVTDLHLRSSTDRQST